MGFFDLFSKKEKKETLDNGLQNTKTSVFSKLAHVIAGKSKVDDDVLDDLEDVLITSDVGVDTTRDMGLEALRNPNSPKVVLGQQQQALYFSRSVIPYLRGIAEEEWLSRHVFYKHIGLYAYRTAALEQITALPQSPLEQAESLEQLRWLEAGMKIRVGITEHETIGIDTPDDLRKAEEFLCTKR